MIIDPRIKLAVAAIALAASAGAGWTVNGWRGTAAIDALRVENARALGDAMSAALKAQGEAKLAGEQLATLQSKIDTDESAKLKEAKDETQRLRDGIANGSLGLRVNAKCPAANRADVPQANAPSSLDNDASPRLDADAERNYFTLRDAIATVTRQLAACQQVIVARDAP